MYIIIVQSGNCKEANISDFQNIAGNEVTSGSRRYMTYTLSKHMTLRFYEWYVMERNKKMCEN